ncbi:diguanylate cyclase [Thioalkalivibrio paradoxus]|uniref:Diguanylate cyclase n=1 Tax=Thioalkalivibrio paradoxus ARh 1 TaxID=713585 RepID=W0DQ18_9GAMM|nr:diguanylate cyclase [Thioalkalivibrio paradoxus]AHE98970.1 hypothetical protein THITH_12710 [Thioalkalivibrio paradoxus ARh 1]
MRHFSFAVTALLGSALLALSFVLIGVFSWHQERKTFERTLAQEAVSLHTTFEVALANLEQKMLGLATMTAADPGVQRLVSQANHSVAAEGGGPGGEDSDRLRTALHDLLASTWDDMQGRSGVRQFQFYLETGPVSFLRMHAPGHYGDDLLPQRQLVRDVNADQQPRAGFETGRTGSGVRAAVPVWHVDPDGKRHFAGALELGASFDSTIAQLGQQTGAGFAVLLTRQHLERAVLNDFRAHAGSCIGDDCRWYLAATSDERTKDWATAAMIGPSTLAGSRLIERDGGTWHLAGFPLRDYRGQGELEREPVGSVLIWQDKTHELAAWRGQRWQQALLLLMAYSLGQAGLLWSLWNTRRGLNRGVARATLALRERADVLQRAESMAHMGSWRLEMPAGEHYWSPETRQIFGVDPDVPADRDLLLARVHAEDREHVDSAWQAALRGAPYDVEYRIQANGAMRWVREMAEFSFAKVGQPISAIGTVQDITDAKPAELALRASEERYRSTLAAVKDGLWEWHVPSGEVWWDRRCYEMLGYPPAAFKVDLETWRNLIHPDDVAQSYREVERQLAEGETFVIEFRYRCADDGWLWVQGRGKVVAWKQGKPLRVVGTHTDISARKEVEEALHRMARRNELLLMAAGEGIYGVDLQGHTTFINPAALEMLGYTEAEILGKGQHAVFHHTRPDGRPYPESECPVTLTLEDGEPRRCDDEWFFRKDGSRFPIALTVAPVEEAGERSGAVVLFQDMTTRRAMEQALQKASTRLATVIGSFHGGILLEDETRHILLANQTFCELFSIPAPPDALVGADCSGSAEQVKGLFAHPERFVRRIDELLQRRESVIGEELSMADGRALERDYVPIVSEQGFLGHLWLYRDITERKEREFALHRLATTDTLTGLPNRRYFLERLEQELARFHRHHKVVALTMIDIDHFKQVNDSHGHVVGDAVLRHLAELLWQSLRKTDLAGRLGGEEFAVLLPGSDLEGGRTYAERLRERVASTPCVHAGTEIRYTVSIGVTVLAEQDTSSDQPLARADAGLYSAKDKGRNRVESQD